MMMTHKINQRATCRYPQARGFTLLEVMIALVIFSIGLLGLAALQGQSVSYNGGAYHRSQAVFLISDIMDRMRANRAEALNCSQQSCPYDIKIGTPATNNPNCDQAGANCSASDIKTEDWYEWKQELQQVLPNGDGSIAHNISGAVTTFTITVQWTDPNAHNGTGTSQLSATGEL